MTSCESLSLISQPSEITAQRNIFERLQNTDEVINLVLIGTKPDIIKQFPLIAELKRQQKCVVIVHSGQHYDWALSGGMEEEFDIVPDFNLNVRGSLFEQQSQIIAKLGFILEKLRKMKKVVVPFTYSDTTTAVAGGIASYLNDYAVAHVEAGLRTMTPDDNILFSLLKGCDVHDFYEKLRSRLVWHKGSYEPFPEQFDTRVSAPSAKVHFAPTDLNKEHLVAEGYDPARIFVVGNPVADAIRLVEKKNNPPTVFEKYPKLEEGNFIRFCVHRRENIISKHRFGVIIKAMISLVEKGENVLLISLGATEKALSEYGFKDRISLLAEKHRNFIYSGVWPYYGDVVAGMKKCSVVATDSGSIQEETNVLGIPGVVLRFNSDRPEAVFHGTNILAPPVKSEVVEKIISAVSADGDLRNRMKKAYNIYGENVSQKMVGVINEFIKNEQLFNLFEHQRLGMDKLDFWEKGELQW